MSTAIFEAPRSDQAAEQIPFENLPTAMEKLGALRYLIILTARWESSDSTEPARRKVMRRDLARLRRNYSDKIDEIAMNHGVQQAINAKECVERSVTVPKSARPPMRMQELEQAWF